MATLTIRNLTIGYGNTVIQKELTLAAEAGKMICLLGQNGCGKSTLLRTLSGLLKPLSGEVLSGEKNLLTLREQERAKQLAIVLTERTSAERTTVRDVVGMGRYPYSTWVGGLSTDDERIIADAMAATEITHKKDAFFNNLSDGEKQRALIAKAIAQQTPYILLDEPTAHLDLPNRIKTLLLLSRLAHETGRTVLISTHELDLALQTADTIWLMTPQKGVAVGSPEELIANGAFAQAFQDEHFRFVGDGRKLSIELT